MMRRVLTIVLFVLLSAIGLANGEVKWTVSQIEGATTPGSKAVIVVQAEIQPGWHLYSVVPVSEGPFATTFKAEDITLSEPFIEQPLYREFDDGFKKEINLFKDKATFWVPVQFGPKGLDGKLAVQYQVCKDGVCIPPQPVDLDLKSAKVVTESTMPAKQAEPISESGSITAKSEQVTWSVSQIEGSVAPGGQANVVIQAKLQPGWHLYSVVQIPDGPFPTTFSMGETALLEGIVEQQLYREYDKGFLKDVNLFKDNATFWVPVKFGAEGQNTKITVSFQVCNDGKCIKPPAIDLDLKTAKVVTESTKPDASPAPTTSSAPKITEGPTGSPTGDKSGEVGKIEEAKARGVIAYLWLAISAGFLALLTPCVFPMIPITVSFFSKKKEGENSLHSALLYCGGIIGTFTILGIGVSIIAGATGLSRLANNPWMNLALALIFIVLALSLFGVFEIGLPSKFVNKFDATGKSKYLAPILMGLTFSLTSFTCTLPFVGAVLVGAANGGWFYPMVGMLGFSTAFCIPFMLLALFPEALSKLPKSGAWMVTVKAYMGFIELIAAVKFLSTFDLSFEFGWITREVNLALWFMLLVIAAIYLFGWIRLPKVYDGKVGPLRIAFGVATMLLALKIGGALSGGTLGSLEGFLPPSPYPGKTSSMTPAWEKDFLPDFEAAKAAAKENGKPIFIDFTGIYCTNCRVMERTVFPSAKVQAAFEKFNKVSLYTDRTLQDKYKESDGRNAALQQKLVRTATLPTYVVVQPDGETVIGSTPFDDSVDSFTKFLEDSANRAASSK